MGKERWRQHFHAAISLTMARFHEEECFAKPIKQDLQQKILCQLHREVESVWEQDAGLKEVSHEIRTLKDNIRKMVFVVYRGPPPCYFHSVIRGIENAIGKLFFVIPFRSDRHGYSQRSEPGPGGSRVKSGRTIPQATMIARREG